jgi:hypothetical protein
LFGWLIGVLALGDIGLIAFYKADIANSWLVGNWPRTEWEINWPAALFWSLLLIWLVFFICREFLKGKDLFLQHLRCLGTWGVLCLLLYKYVYLQLGLINGHFLYLSILVLLIVFAFFLAGSETALSNVGPSDLALWGLETDQAREALYLKLAQNTGYRKIWTPFAKRGFYLRNSCRTNFWVRDRKVNVQDRLGIVVVCNNIININLVILLAICLTKSSWFLNGANMPRHLPSFGTASFLDRFLPLAGDAGFSSVGVTVILLVLAELIPKKLALHDPMKFLRISVQGIQESHGREN